MLNKKNRLAKDSEIKAVFAKGRAFFNPFFTVKFLPKAGSKRFTVVVSTKVYKNAVKRNRLKRIIREILRKDLASYKAGDYTIIAKPKISAVSEKELLEGFKSLASKLK